MVLTVGQLREILKNPDIADDLPVTFVGVRSSRYVADSAYGTAIIERDTQSHAPATGRIVEPNEAHLRGDREKVFALYDQ